MISLQFDADYLPEGYRVVPVWPEVSGPLSICILVGTAASSVGSPLVLLRNTADAFVYLGCIADCSGHPKTFVEFWVQNLDRAAASWRAQVEALTNVFWDRRWAGRVDLLRSSKRSSIIETGFENRHPPPFFIDRGKGSIVDPVEPGSERKLSLCQDESALAKVGLPSYASTLHRYVWTGPGNPAFFSASNDAPLAPGVKPLADLFRDSIPLNPACGLIAVRLLAPLSLVEFSDILSGKPWAGFQPGGVSFRIGGVYASLEDPDALLQRGRHLFSGRAGRNGRLLEVFHLKLNLIQQAFRELKQGIAGRQLPFLLLGGESFRVQLSEIGTGLPLFWGSRVDLVESVSALPLSVGNGDSRYFLPAETPARSIYHPEMRGIPERGFATLRIRKVLPPGKNGTSLEATLASDERLSVAASDLIHVSITLPSGPVDLFGKVDESQALAAGETRFRTIPQRFTGSVQNALELAAGAPIGSCSFEVLPLLSSPVDMYAVAVLAIRILLVDEEKTLPVALDEMLSLARQIASEFKPETSLRERILRIVQADLRWATSLGPHRLVFDAGAREAAARVLPADLWWETLSVLVESVPGMGPDSICRDLGDAPPVALDSIFDGIIDRLDTLLRRSRSLVVADWNQNLEIHDAIYEVISKKPL